MRDVKDVVGVIMQVLDGAEITQADILDLEFEAEGELMIALNEAFIKRLEFAHDRDRRRDDRELDQSAREALQGALDRIVRLSEPAAAASDIVRPL
jgi:hypothetical protein